MVTQERPVKPRLAATCVVLRDGPTGPQVLMVERSRDIVFGGGALVFPGGKLDHGDQYKIGGRYLRNARALPHITRALAIAAVREVFEETGILLTRSHSAKRPAHNRRRAKLAQQWRERLAKDRCDMDAFFRAAGHYLDFRDIAYYARWITPQGMVKRYDTHFFLARAPQGQIPTHDGWELVSAHWLTPLEALQLEQDKQVKLMFPTRMNLRRLAKMPSVHAAFSMMRTESIVPVLPQLEKVEGRVMARIPRNAGYGTAGLVDRVAL
ncbi:MAG: NUDIX hydrolase [Pseudomonadota bacterium]